MGRKIRKCPKCKGTSGFEITTWLGGYDKKNMTFDGKITHHERCGMDDVENYATCLDCNHTLDVEKLDITNV